MSINKISSLMYITFFWENIKLFKPQIEPRSVAGGHGIEADGVVEDDNSMPGFYDLRLFNYSQQNKKEIL